MKTFISCMLVLISAFSAAQKKTLYESKEYKEAYEKNTRSRTGIPGKGYWQNRSDYEIDANFDPESRIIEGHLKVTYDNKSPDPLNMVVFKLMQNVYKKGATRQMEIDEVNVHEGIAVDNIIFNGKKLDHSATSISGTILKITLSDAIDQNSSGVLEMDFSTPMPKSSGYRSGSIDSSSFFVAYWFPQVAVYDDIFGWDLDQYVGVPENYNDFSTYHVSITLPSQFNIWATGKHINREDVFSDEIVGRIEHSKSSPIPIKIIGEEDFRQPNGESNTWEFVAENVPDFAWGTSDHYVWEGQAANNPDPDHICWVQTAYPIGARHFDWVIGVAKQSVELFSKEFPGVPYPYFKHVTFRGTKGGGMEFPMLANNNVAFDSTGTIMVTAHELAHNYFPFMVGINERKYGWWDETIVTLMESYLKEKAYPRHRIQGFFNRKISYNLLAPQHDVLPLITETSSMMKVMPTITNFYVKGPAAMDILIDLIGQKKFYTYLKLFMEKWAWKHPSPFDFFYFINESEGKNLNWFWHSWFFSFGYPDLAIANASQNEQYLIVEVENVGGLPIPFGLNITYLDGSRSYETFNVKIWEQNEERTTIRVPIMGVVEKVSIDRAHSYESNSENNEYLLKKNSVPAEQK